MELYPETTLGNFYNRQRRNTDTYQWISRCRARAMRGAACTCTSSASTCSTTCYDGSSTSDPVLIRRSDGTLARRLDFGPTSTQSVDSTDLALFLQDRIQPTTRWYAELGGRIDRDGITRRLNATPRIGTAVLLNEAGTSVVRGGFGLFYERTPSTAGAFGGFENAVDTRFAADGVTPLGPPTLFQHVVAPGLRDAAQPHVGRRLRLPRQRALGVSSRRDRSRRHRTSSSSCR